MIDKDTALLIAQRILDETNQYRREEDQKLNKGLKLAADIVMQEFYFGRTKREEEKELKSLNEWREN